MRDFRPILNILGLLLCIESIALLIPMVFDYINNNEDWKQFFFISCLTFFIGLVLYVGFKNEKLKNVANKLLYFFAIIIPISTLILLYKLSL